MQNTYLFIQVSSGSNELPPVRTEPSLTPDTLGVYGSLVILFSTLSTVTKPLMEKLWSLVNDSVKNRKDKEDKALDAQLEQTRLVQANYIKQQEFMQQLISNGAKVGNYSEVLNRIEDTLKGIKKNTDDLTEVMNSTNEELTQEGKGTSKD